MGLITTPLKIVLAVAILGVAAATLLPMYVDAHRAQKTKQVGEAQADALPSSASAVQAVAPVVQAVAPTVQAAAPVVQALTKTDVESMLAEKATADKAAAEKMVKMRAAALARAEAKQKAEALAAVAAATPKFETVTKHVCENKTVTVEVDVPDPAKPVEHNPVGLLLGGAAGALLGHQIGNGTGQTVATIAGAAGGAYAGDKLANSGEQPKAGTHKEQRSQVAEVCHDETSQVRVK